MNELCMIIKDMVKPNFPKYKDINSDHNRV